MTVATKVLVSNVCRAPLTQDVLDLAKVGIVPIPGMLLASREIEITAPKDHRINAKLKWHRDAFIPVVSRKTANFLIEKEWGKYRPQSLLSYTRDSYLGDPDVISDTEEHKRVSESDCELVIVAVIGGARSTLSVCRNIVSGCQDSDTLLADAKQSVEAANVFLIED